MNNIKMASYYAKKFQSILENQKNTGIAVSNVAGEAFDKVNIEM